MKKIKYISTKGVVVAFSIFIATRVPVSALASESITKINTLIDEEITQFESKLIGSYSVSIYEENGLLKVSSTVISPYTLDYLEANISLQELIGNNWTTVAQFSDSINNNYLLSTKDSYIPVSSSTYRAKVSFTAKKGSIKETKEVTSNAKKFYSNRCIKKINYAYIYSF